MRPTQVVGPTLGAFTPTLRWLVESAVHTRPRDLFLWAVIHGNDELAHAFWTRCNNPMHMAILGAAVAHRMTATVYLGAQELGERADRLTGWAIGALDMAPDEAAAFRVLESSVLSERQKSVLARRWGPAGSALESPKYQFFT